MASAPHLQHHPNIRIIHSPRVSLFSVFLTSLFLLTYINYQHSAKLITYPQNIALRHYQSLSNKMSQGQEQRPRSDQFPDQEPIRYGDVFNVSGELASKPIAPRDAAAMQAAENIALGQTQRGGPAAVMQSAAALNKRAGLVSREDASDIASEQGVGVSQDHVGGNRVTRETVGGQVIHLSY